MIGERADLCTPGVWPDTFSFLSALGEGGFAKESQGRIVPGPAVAASRAVTQSLMDINDHINNDDNDQTIRHRREGVSSAQANLLLNDEAAHGQAGSPEDTTLYKRAG